MSLRARVVVLIGTVLLVSVLTGALVAGFQTRQALRAELEAGLMGARQTVEGSFEDLPNSDHQDHDLRQLIGAFNGSRHVQATLLDDAGGQVARSQLEAANRFAPSWFRPLLGPPPPAVTVDVPASVAGYRAILLEPVSEIDIAVSWRQLVAIVTVLTGLTALGLVLVYLVIGAAFRPLRVLTSQFDRIGMGDYSGRVAEDGPSELLGLERGFNRMAVELAATTERNRLLTEQLQTLQDEERAEIARDLHDEFGPHLFAVNMDAEMIVQLHETGRGGAIPDQARSIQGAVRHMQRQVRDLLGRLRPTQVTELGLNAAVADLVDFWQARRPDIAFDVALLDDETRLPEAVKDVAYRVVQEAANNAVRHGDPATIHIRLVLDGGRALRVSVTDDGAGSRRRAGPAALAWSAWASGWRRRAVL